MGGKGRLGTQLDRWTKWMGIRKMVQYDMKEFVARGEMVSFTVVRCDRERLA